MDSNSEILAKRYARSYMCLEGKVFGASADAAARTRLDGLRKVFEVSRPHLKTLTHPALNSAIKLEVLARILGPHGKTHGAEFARFLITQGRFSLFERVMVYCLRMHDAFSGVVRAEVYSRFLLSAGEMKRINALLTDGAGKKVVLRNIVAERVLGGFEIKIGDTVIDATVRGRLEALKAALRN